MVTDPASLWELDPDDLAELPGWGVLSASNLMLQLEEAKTRPLNRLVFALGIPHVGERAARLLATRFGSIAGLARADLESLMAIDGIGPVMASSIGEWFEDPGNRELVERLRKQGVDPREEMSPAGDLPLDETTVVITGSHSRPRGQIKERLEALGARVVGSVSKNTTYLLAREAAGSKLEKARRLGVRVVDEDELDAVVREHHGRGLWER
jgi:DNA ligase (NAD+)